MLFLDGLICDWTITWFRRDANKVGSSAAANRQIYKPIYKKKKNDFIRNGYCACKGRYDARHFTNTHLNKYSQRSLSSSLSDLPTHAPIACLTYVVYVCVYATIQQTAAIYVYMWRTMKFCGILTINKYWPFSGYVADRTVFIVQMVHKRGRLARDSVNRCVSSLSLPLARSVWSASVAH